MGYGKLTIPDSKKAEFLSDAKKVLENRVAGTGEAISRSDCTCQTSGHLSCSDLGRAQNAGPTESAPLRTTRVPEPEWLGPGKCI